MKQSSGFLLIITAILAGACDKVGESTEYNYSLTPAQYGKVISLLDEPTDYLAPGWESGESVIVASDVDMGSPRVVQGGKVTVALSSEASKVYVIRGRGADFKDGSATVSPSYDGSASDAAIAFARSSVKGGILQLEAAGSMLVFSVAQTSVNAVRIHFDESVFPIKFSYDFGWKKVKAQSKSRKVEIRIDGRSEYYIPLLPDVQLKSYMLEWIDAEGKTVATNNGALVWKTVAGQALVLGQIDADIPVIDPSVQPAEPAADAIKAMGVGVNLSGSFDEVWEELLPSANRNDPSTFERMNGNGLTTQATLNAIAQAGFKSVRIPITWWAHMDSPGTTIDKVWMDRIAEVVDYTLNAGLYCIINLHHDCGGTSSGRHPWLVADSANYGTISPNFQSVWSQIATHFKDYGDKLLFEGYNEILDAQETWFSPKDPNGFDTANKLNQDFVNAVRKTGGLNSTRNLIVSTFSCGDREESLRGFKMPNDIRDGHIIVQIHSYWPAEFVTVKPSIAVATYDQTKGLSEIRSAMARVKAYITDKGWPCVMGEYGASPFYFSSDYSQKLPRAESERAKHALDATREALNIGIAPIYWYIPMTGSDRASGKWTEPSVKNALIQAWEETQ